MAMMSTPIVHGPFAAARTRAEAGERAFVDRTDVGSCHRVWFELHEDLIATLGIDRGAEPEPAHQSGGA